MSEIDENLKFQLSLLPDSPGVYQYFDKEGKIIYVGKAKNLKRRVSSYFNKNHDNNKVRILVSKIVDIKHIVVSTESDALLLENTLIKKHQPRYNILLKDGKTYPWICVKHEPFPRIFSTRNYVNDGSFYFGPFTSTTLVRSLLALIKELFPLRTCNLDLSLSKIDLGKYKPCLEYHLGNCLAPCLKLQVESDYLLNISVIKEILRGNLSYALNYLKQQMDDFAKQYKFEEAELVKKRILLIQGFQSKSSVVSASESNLEVFSLILEDDIAYINFLRIVDGCVNQSHSFQLQRKLDEEEPELLTYAIVEMRERKLSVCKDLILPFKPDTDIEGVKYIFPTKGDKYKLLELSLRNAKFFMLECKKAESLKNPKERTEKLLEQMKNDLQLDVLPVHIECFDNSNLQGTNPVASCVVFKNTVPAKRDYRHFNVKTVEGPDDFASMTEIVYRRYSRMLSEGTSLPQLIIVDGGKGQLNAALKSLNELGIQHKVQIIGIAKRLEEIYFPGESFPIYIDKKSPTLKIIQQLRDEAHRFGITFHRSKRSKSMVQSNMMNIPGIGEKTYQLLIKTFGSVKEMQNVSEEKLIELIGDKRAKLIVEYLKSNKQ
jgi:excinuclease ABC subunit C